MHLLRVWLLAPGVWTLQPSTCCTKLDEVAQLKGKVYMPNTAAYEQRLNTYYSANAALSPWCMVMPNSTEDVSKTVRILADNECPFGIRSCAHSAYRGANSVEDGVTIDFGYMNRTVYDPKNKIARIEPGSNWGLVYRSLDSHGVSTVGARASPVGVGGFVTGGGYSFHSNTKGFACDQVVNFEVVLADGRIVNANKDEHPDLWKSLKGGSGNLGLVTRVDQRKKFPKPPRFVEFDLSQRDAVFKEYINFVEANDNDPASQLIVTMQWDGESKHLLSVVSNSDAVESPASFSGLFNIPSTSNTTTKGKIADVVPQFTGPTPLGLYANWMTGTTTNDKRVMTFMHDKFDEYVDKMRMAAPSSKFSVLVQFQPVTPSMVKHSQDNGGNVLGLESVVAKGPALMWLIAVTVDTETNQEKIDPLTREFKADIEAYADEMGIGYPWVYLNYARGGQHPLSHYGSENIDMIRKASKKYDPDGVFQHLRRSGFKIPVRRTY
ncbi:FAD binding domain-containing protein [Fusarium flagelliforme]|uniref:FAD binding domain-containing protein n=1 Tax=Fusarium flagelliforme TaxID=2675880 RepID=A0A395N343_9HYPO|nr:FAD binding domain-containing protein [Fusarium flagelliforme]